MMRAAVKLTEESPVYIDCQWEKEKPNRDDFPPTMSSLPGDGLEIKF